MVQIEKQQVQIAGFFPKCLWEKGRSEGIRVGLTHEETRGNFLAVLMGRETCWVSKKLTGWNWFVT